jgi:hypothetical protein
MDFSEGAGGGKPAKIKLLQKTRNDPGMLMKTKDRFRKSLERNRNVKETKGVRLNPGMS